MNDLYLANLHELDKQGYEDFCELPVSPPFKSVNAIPLKCRVWNPEWRISVDRSLEEGEDDLFWDFVEDTDPYEKLKREFVRLEWERVISYLIEKLSEKIKTAESSMVRRTKVSSIMCSPMSPRYGKSTGTEKAKNAVYAGRDSYKEFTEKGVSPPVERRRIIEMLKMYGEETGLLYDDICRRSQIKGKVLQFCED